jgi:hypothetical protein
MRRAPVPSGWLWTGYRMKAGYGKPGKHLAHRLSYKERVAPVPEGSFVLHRSDVLHRCDVPTCINPEHLVAGTPTDNMRDMLSKERQTSAKLNWDAVGDIRQRYAEGGVTQEPLAANYGVTVESISNVLRRRTWRPKLTTLQAA